jgi:hypothetical protein
MLHYFSRWRQAIARGGMPERKEQRFDTQIAVELEGGGSGVARNVSASGIFLVTDVALKAGQPVSFKLQFKDFPSGPIEVKCSARVVRVEEQGASLGIGASIESFEFRIVPKATKAPVRQI